MLGPGRCVALPADLQRVEETERLARELGARESALHVLVNNAGAAWGEGIDEYPVRVCLLFPWGCCIHGRNMGVEKG